MRIRITKRYHGSRTSFTSIYTSPDVLLLAHTDTLHGTLSGLATKKLMERACHVFGDARYERLAIYRPVVPVGKADVGFLPGSLEEKLEPWMSAVVDALAALTDERSYVAARETIDELMCRGRLSMESVTFLRGRTLQSSFIVVDEAQNLEPATVKTILTRVGEGAKIVFCGDRDQIDAPYLSAHNNGLALLLDAFRGQTCFGGVRLMTCERSDVAALAATLL